MVSCDNIACGVNAQCAVANHATSCVCDAGLYPKPDAETECVKCTEDSHCSNGKSCVNDECVTVCSQHSDCSDAESCENGQCEPVTCDSVTCGVNAECVVSNHEAACECDTGFLVNPDPKQGCAKCIQDSDCITGEKCLGNMCVTSCTQDSNCADNEACDTNSSSCAEVICPFPMDRSAIKQCGANAICAVANHVATCQCEAGFQPNPDAATGCDECIDNSHCSNGQTCLNNKCITACTQDTDCSDSESCKNGICEEVTCNNLTCGSKAQCSISNNAASCQCDTGYYAVTTPDDGCGEY